MTLMICTAIMTVNLLALVHCQVLIDYHAFQEIIDAELWMNRRQTMKNCQPTEI